MKLRILKICTSRSWGGMELHMALTCEKLQQRGHKVFPVCYAASPIEKRLISSGFKPFQLNLTSYVHPFKIIKLARYIKKSKIDLIHADYSRDLWTIVPAMQLSQRKPLVLLKHIGTRRPKTDLLHQYIYRHVDYVIAISKVIRKNIIETHPVNPEKVGVIYHGVDFQRFKPDPDIREAIRTEFDIRPTDFLMGIVGRLQVAKGYFEFLEMADRISRKYQHARFMIVGEATRGEERQADAILARIDGMNLGKKLIVTGYRDDVPALLAAMDLFVFPSYAEAFGLVLIEAMGMRLPVVSSNCDGVLDIVVHNETGLLVAPRNANELSRAVASLIENESLRSKMGEAGYRRAREKFDEAQMLNQLEHLYESLIY